MFMFARPENIPYGVETVLHVEDKKDPPVTRSFLISKFCDPNWELPKGTEVLLEGT